MKFTVSGQPQSPGPRISLTAGNPRWAGSGSRCGAGGGTGGWSRRLGPGLQKGGGGQSWRKGVFASGEVGRSLCSLGLGPTCCRHRPGDSSPRCSRAWGPAVSSFGSLLGWRTHRWALSHSGASSWGRRGPKSGRPGSEGREGTPHSHRGGLLPASPVLETQPAGWGPGPPPPRPALPLSTGGAGLPVRWPPASFLPGGRGAQKGSTKARGQNTETQVDRTPGSLARRPNSSRPAPILTPSVPCFPMSYLEKQQRGNK